MAQSQLEQDLLYLIKTFALAKKGQGFVNPGPMVGAVIVKDGRIIGQGFYVHDGAPHAETEAIQLASENLVGATLYVNLEPHAHVSRTPPCTDAIIESGIKRVVCATLDPNPQVQGKGVRTLRRAGIEVVIVKELGHEAELLNEAYFTFYQKKRPFVVLKWAESMDGKIATRNYDSKWITNEESRVYARSLRGRYQAVLVGIRTVLNDNPHLGVREATARDPWRIILDSKLHIPLTASVLRDERVIIATTKQANKSKLRALVETGATVIVCGKKEVAVKELIRALTKKKIVSILVEGGGEVLGSFVDERLFDKAYIFQAPILIGGHKSVGAIGGQGVGKVSQAIRLKNVSLKQFGDNFVFTGYAPER